ncbi:MAG TPA: hypothetical protein P5555_05825 [Candidatus Paceibacterota bacterium]|nr:hypothetical protein [Verrucomicrobiota bacterium]HOX04288.1 hypothetical protein [Verrucomicrobiota bacterium]HRZ44690.1 hypothetical protein [Candidatus Paceibacterota bacterium]HRZ91676.1 hypothetical protein [Candidatus Paceibacterota bacterium]
MKTRDAAWNRGPIARRGASRLRPANRGYALLVVFTVLTLVMAFSAANLRQLSSMKREIQLIERRQMLKFSPSSLAIGRSAAATNGGVQIGPLPASPAAAPPP